MLKRERSYILDISLKDINISCLWLKCSDSWICFKITQLWRVCVCVYVCELGLEGGRDELRLAKCW